MVDLTPEAKKHEEIAEENRKALEKANAEATDWRATCKKCGRQLKGTLADLQAHSC